MPSPDVFLSYNRKDSAIARSYANALTLAGFDVWWDDALKSGEAYDEVTEAALRCAKAVVVLWSPRSVVSRWVRAEATNADRNKTLIPVLIEPCDRPIMFELTQAADLTLWDGAIEDPTWISFVSDVRHLVARRNEIPTKKYQNLPTSEDLYEIVTLDKLLRADVPATDVLKELDDIYSHFPDPEDHPNDYGDPDKWNKFMVENPTYVHCLIRNNEKIVAYWFCLPISNEIYCAGLEGKNINAELGKDDIDSFSVPGDYKLYLVDLFRLDELNTKPGNSSLYISFLEFLEDSLAEGFNVTGVFANVSTVPAANLCKRLRFEFVCEHSEHKMLDKAGVLVPTKVFALNLDSDRNGGVQEYCRQLRARFSLQRDKSLNIADDDESRIRSFMAKGENDGCEFKTALGRRGHFMQDEAIRTVAGFLNAKGGILLVGVTDDGSARGLNLEGFPTIDALLRHFEDVAIAQLGAVAMANLTKQIVEVDNKPILIVQCEQSRRPVYLKAHKEDPKFHVRMGQRTVELKGKEIADYFIGRF